MGVWEGSEGSSREEKGFGLEGLEVQVPMADENGESSSGEIAMLVSEGFYERDRRDIERESKRERVNLLLLLLLFTVRERERERWWALGMEGK